jgi:hypothetical protein
MSSALKVAEWMASRLEDKGYLYQDQAVSYIKKNFGDDYVYHNANGNPAISKEVLKEFLALTDGRAVWERGEKAWRLVREKETYKSRQVD